VRKNLKVFKKGMLSLDFGLDRSGLGLYISRKVLIPGRLFCKVFIITRLCRIGDAALRRHNIEQIDRSPYSIVAGWGDEFLSLSRMDGVSCAIFLDKVLGGGVRAMDGASGSEAAP
jgi:hypothetical protein